MVAVTPRKPFEPIAQYSMHRTSTLFGAAAHKRDRSTTVSLSKESFDKLYREAEKRGGASISGLVGFVADYLVRAGKFPELLDAAIAEDRKP